MTNAVPRVAAIHDLSCFGRCSLTVIIPTLSAMGVQVCPLPTAVLSTHLGGFAGLEFCDFTGHMPAFYRHWQRESLAFDCIYSGFLASEQQIDVVIDFISAFSANQPLILVDPVMGDEGRLYSTCTPQLQQRMITLVRKADVITPNFTEAGFLLGEKYQQPFPDTGRVEAWARRLAQLGPATVVITGIPVAPGKLLNVGYDRQTGAYWQDLCDCLPVNFPGTGDLYASVLLGSLLSPGGNLATAMERASGFVAMAIRATRDAGSPTREGVLLERVLPWLLHAGRKKGGGIQP